MASILTLLWFAAIGLLLTTVQSSPLNEEDKNVHFMSKRNDFDELFTSLIKMAINQINVDPDEVLEKFEYNMNTKIIDDLIRVFDNKPREIIGIDLPVFPIPMSTSQMLTILYAISPLNQTYIKDKVSSVFHYGHKMSNIAYTFIHGFQYLNSFIHPLGTDTPPIYQYIDNTNNNKGWFNNFSFYKHKKPSGTSTTKYASKSKRPTTPATTTTTKTTTTTSPKIKLTTTEAKKPMTTTETKKPMTTTETKKPMTTTKDKKPPHIIQNHKEPNKTHALTASQMSKPDKNNKKPSKLDTNTPKSNSNHTEPAPPAIDIHIKPNTTSENTSTNKTKTMFSYAQDILEGFFG